MGVFNVERSEKKRREHAKGKHLWNSQCTLTSYWRRRYRLVSHCQTLYTQHLLHFCLKGFAKKASKKSHNAKSKGHHDRIHTLNSMIECAKRPEVSTRVSYWLCFILFKATVGFSGHGCVGSHFPRETCPKGGTTLVVCLADTPNGNKGVAGKGVGRGRSIEGVMTCICPWR